VLADIVPILRIYAAQGAWGTNTGTGYDSPIVEELGLGDSTTVFTNITLGCVGDSTSFGMVRRLGTNCVAQFSRSYRFDQGKNVALYSGGHQPFVYQAGRYHWELVVSYRADGDTENWSETPTLAGDFELVYPVGSVPGTPTNFEMTVTNGNLFFTWLRIFDYDATEYRLFSRPPGGSWTQATSADSRANSIFTAAPDSPTEYRLAAYSPGRGLGAYTSALLYTPSSTNRPTLSIRRQSNNIVFSWPTNFSGFSLKSKTDLNPGAWSLVSPSPVVVNGQFTVTNSTSGGMKFFRLEK
jgi:hypothetical protein